MLRSTWPPGKARPSWRQFPSSHRRENALNQSATTNFGTASFPRARQPEAAVAEPGAALARCFARRGASPGDPDRRWCTRKEDDDAAAHAATANFRRDPNEKQNRTARKKMEYWEKEKKRGGKKGWELKIKQRRNVKEKKNPKSKQKSANKNEFLKKNLDRTELSDKKHCVCSFSLPKSNSKSIIKIKIR